MNDDGDGDDGSDGGKIIEKICDNYIKVYTKYVITKCTKVLCICISPSC